MKVLTVRQPWAGAIVFQGKDVENRTRRTNYRGVLAIHASKRHDYDAAEQLVDIRGGLDQHNIFGWGHILGTVRLIDCIQDSTSEWAQPGLWHWVLTDPIPFSTPIPAVGRLGLWDFDINQPMEGTHE